MENILESLKYFKKIKKIFIKSKYKQLISISKLEIAREDETYKLNHIKPQRSFFRKLRIVKIIYTQFVNFFSPYCGFDIRSSTFSIIVGSLFIPIRFLLINLIKIIDHVSEIPFGSEILPVRRKIFYGDLNLNVSSRTEGIDIRNCIWKKDALNLIIKNINKTSPNRINFLEVGSASGLVSLFLAKWANKRGLEYEITCIEPSLSNVQFLEETAIKNMLNIQIIPLALSNQNGWIKFCRDETRGLVGDAIDVINKEESNRVPSIDSKTLETFDLKVDICYIDAFVNESSILINILETYKNIKYLIVEFDYGVPTFMRDKLKQYSYEQTDEIGINYFFSKIE